MVNRRVTIQIIILSFLLLSCSGLILDSNVFIENASLKTGEFYYQPESIQNFLEVKAAFFSNIAELREIGYSSGNPSLPIYALKITDNPDREEEEAEIQITAALHGNEQISMEMTLKLIEYLLDEYQQGDPDVLNIIDNTEIHIIPVVNPFGLLNNTRHNGNDIDLNRNFSFAWINSNNSGDTPFDQPESRAIRDDAEDNNYSLSINCHTGSLAIVYSWDYAGRTFSYSDPTKYSIQYFKDNLLPAYDVVYGAARSYRQNVSDVSSLQLMLTEGFDWFPAFGTIADWMYGEKGAAAFTIEFDKRKSFVEEEDILIINQTWEIHKAALFELLNLSMTGLHGIITDIETGNPVNAIINISEVGDPPKGYITGYTDPDVGDFHIIAPFGIYNVVVSASGYQEKIIEDVEIREGDENRIEISVSRMKSSTGQKGMSRSNIIFIKKTPVINDPADYNDEGRP